MVNQKILKKYTHCIGVDCKYNNNIMLKKVYTDSGYIPLCQDCRRRFIVHLNRLHKKVQYLSREEIIEVYKKTRFPNITEGEYVKR